MSNRHLRLVAIDGHIIQDSPQAPETVEPEEPEEEPLPPSPSEQECTVWIMEEHLATLEKAALVLAYSLQRSRTLLEELKEQSGWKFKIPAPSAVFGDAVLFQDSELRVVKRNRNAGPPDLAS